MALRSIRFAGDQDLEACLAGNHDLAYGETSDSVRKLQQALLDLGYPIPDGATGGFFAQTQAAVRAFQTVHELSPDAIVGRNTMGALDAAALGLESGGEEPSPPSPPHPSAPVEAVEAAAGVDVGAADWECVGIAQVGGAVVLAAGIYCFEFRSRSANFRGQYLFVGAGLGLGGSLGGGAGPSPADFVSNTQPNLWTTLVCSRPFSGNELDKRYAALTTLGAGVAYGYSLVRITAGWSDQLFGEQDVSGWGTGVGVTGAMMPGIWIRIGMSGYY